MNHLPPPPQPPVPPSSPTMEIPITQQNDPTSPSWNWPELLDFTLEDQFHISLDSLDSDHHHPPENLPQFQSISPNSTDPERVRKRDPRMSCPNFLARVPCACPELDAMVEEVEEQGLPEKKRHRAARSSSAAMRCQVPGCEVDISELKGYHRRHRVCLRCATAGDVVIDGHNKRYCQQCGKFHILSDFDEDKRSCRRKLERHNNRRRRKPPGSRVSAEEESQGTVLSGDLACDDDNGKDIACLSSQILEAKPLAETEVGQMSTPNSNPGSRNIQLDSGVSISVNDQDQIDGGEKDESKYAPSADGDNKSAYSSACPTDRISFKLYDWNPAEFPRRLRLQIFQWLANMPVELEGYIRPGCTILTMFIAMPNAAWFKLHQNPAAHIREFVAAPGNMLFGRGHFFVHLDNKIFHVMKDGTSVVQVEAKDQSPELHYVHPTCFEAGKPLEFVACGRNLLQPNFRFLVSFSGKYLACDCSVLPLYGNTEGITANFGDQLLKIHIHHTEPDVFGPAFVEVENKSGLSNFIPVLISDKEICSEMKIIGAKTQPSSPCNPCEVSVPTRRQFSQFILDMAWLLRKPALGDLVHNLVSSQIRRLNCTLTFLIHNNANTILNRMVPYVGTMLAELKSNSLANGVSGRDMDLLETNFDRAIKLCAKGNLYRGSRIDMSFVDSVADQDIGNSNAPVGLNGEENSGTIRLLNREVALTVNVLKEGPRMYYYRSMFSNKLLTSRPFIYVITSAAVCFGISAVMLSSDKVGQIAATVGMCLF